MTTLREAAQMALEALQYPLETSSQAFDADKAELLSHRAIDALRAALAEPEPVAEANLKEQGWRQCAKGQKTTQFCGMVEQALKAEREACAKLAWVTQEPEDEYVGLRKAIAATIRSRT